jgi:hypothetical protein
VRRDDLSSREVPSCVMSSKCNCVTTVMRRSRSNRERCVMEEKIEIDNGPCKPCLLVITDVSNDYVGAIFRVVSYATLKMRAASSP